MRPDKQLVNWLETGARRAPCVCSRTPCVLLQLLDGVTPVTFLLNTCVYFGASAPVTQQRSFTHSEDGVSFQPSNMCCWCTFTTVTPLRLPLWGQMTPTSESERRRAPALLLGLLVVAAEGFLHGEWTWGAVNVEYNPICLVLGRSSRQNWM